MGILRRLGLAVSVLLFGIFLAAFAFAAGMYSLFTSPQPLKTALQDSGVYGEITPNIADEQMAAMSLPERDIGIKNAFKQALPASFYQQASEKIIDGTYNWASGRSASPEFSIDTSNVKSTFATNVANYVKQQMESLPACERDTAAPTSAKDALSLTCVPKHVTPDNVASATRQQLLASSLFNGDDTITPATLKDGQGRSFKEQFAFLPLLFRSYVPALIALPFVVALLGTAIVFSSASKRKGFRRVAWLLLSTGLTTLVLAAAGIELLHMGVRILGLPLTLAFETQDKLVKAVELLAVDARPWWLGIGIVYALLGIALFIILWARRPQAKLHFSNKE